MQTVGSSKTLPALARRRSPIGTRARLMREHAPEEHYLELAFSGAAFCSCGWSGRPGRSSTTQAVEAMKHAVATSPRGRGVHWADGQRAKARELRPKVIERHGLQCYWCTRPLKVYPPGTVPRVDTLTIDHVKPLRLGGLTALSNLVPSCPKCNSTEAVARG